mmetsp:Transcript_2474/g.9324  ORF Transcript_2474/g.9324 Transcript_2474/m.9324 type:complete len:291 (+) Transcript_2474:1054-1926(+)
MEIQKCLKTFSQRKPHEHAHFRRKEERNLPRCAAAPVREETASREVNQRDAREKLAICKITENWVAPRLAMPGLTYLRAKWNAPSCFSLSKQNFFQQCSMNQPQHQRGLNRRRIIAIINVSYHLIIFWIHSRIDSMHCSETWRMKSLITMKTTSTPMRPKTNYSTCTLSEERTSPLLMVHQSSWLCSPRTIQVASRPFVPNSKGTPKHRSGEKFLAWSVHWKIILSSHASIRMARSSMKSPFQSNPSSMMWSRNLPWKMMKVMTHPSHSCSQEQTVSQFCSLLKIQRIAM